MIMFWIVVGFAIAYLEVGVHVARWYRDKTLPYLLSNTQTSKAQAERDAKEIEQFAWASWPIVWVFLLTTGRLPYLPAPDRDAQNAAADERDKLLNVLAAEVDKSAAGRLEEAIEEAEKVPDERGDYDRG